VRVKQPLSLQATYRHLEYKGVKILLMNPNDGVRKSYVSMSVRAGS
jgi:hypothetical protein